MTNVYRVQDNFPTVLPCYVHVYLRRNGAAQRALDPPISMNNQDNLPQICSQASMNQLNVLQLNVPSL